MDKWDNREAGKDKNLGSKRTIVVLIGLMIGMWVILGFITYAGAPDNCAFLEEYINSNDFDSIRFDRLNHRKIFRAWKGYG